MILEPQVDLGEISGKVAKDVKESPSRVRSFANFRSAQPFAQRLVGVELEVDKSGGKYAFEHEFQFESGRWTGIAVASGPEFKTPQKLWGRTRSDELKSALYSRTIR